MILSISPSHVAGIKGVSHYTQPSDPYSSDILIALISFLLNFEAGCRLLMPIILATEEAEIRRIEVLSQPEQIIHEILSRRYPIQEKGWQSDSSGKSAAYQA
jgi:hypothetical protein